VSRAWRIAALVALGGAMVAVQLAVRGDPDIRRQVVAQVVAFAVFLPAAVLCWRGLRAGWAGLVLVLALAGAFRVAAFVPTDATPPLSTDIHRYAWDGRVLAGGVNPYRFAPIDEELAPLRDDVAWPLVNHPDWTTVYPPGAQAAFVTAHIAFGDGLRATTWLFLLAEAAACALLVLTLLRRRMPPERVAVYAWHPLAISEVAGNGHLDALAVLGLSGLLLAWTHRRAALAGAAVAFAALVKLGPLLLVPALARAGGRRFVLAALALVVAAYLPFLGVGAGVAGSIGDFWASERFNGSLVPLLEPVLGPSWTVAACALVLAATILAVAVRDHRTPEEVARTGLLVLGVLLLAVDYVQPWYALWLVPFMVLTVAPGWMWLTGMLPVSYLYGLDGTLPAWVPWLVYGPLAAAALWRVHRARRPRPAALPPLPARPRVAAVVPVLDEEAGLAALLAELPEGVVDEVVVVDGGSRDGTVAVARAAGATVVVEPRRGYGRACAAVAAAAPGADVLVFLDGDGSDEAAGIPRVLEPVLAGRAALALGARVRCEPGALLPQQRVGNRVVTALVRALHGLRVRDVPSLRAVRRDALERLGMREMTFGWPAEMIVKAARGGLGVAEVEVGYRVRRGGESKVAGRLGASARAGAAMLAVTLRHA
jgi:hypothetical protein